MPERRTSKTVSDTILNRRGSPTTAGVPAEVRRLIAAGEIETVNLSEWLVADQVELARVVCKQNNWPKLASKIESALADIAKPTAPKRMEAIGGVLLSEFRTSAALNHAVMRLQSHSSDIVRSWACYLIGRNESLPLADKLHRLKALAADHNMAVRETAWLAVRPSLAADLTQAFRLLTAWTADTAASVRRFASESTRPRGVWCQHIAQLKQDPSPGLVILEPLRSDESRYVRDSVANWLNDASKSQPDFVRDLCRRWQRESPTAETASLCRRALRTISPARQ